MTTPDAPRTGRMPRRWLILAWAIFLLLAAGWCAHWFALERSVRARLAEATAEQSLRIGSVTTHGFPRMMRFALRDVSYAPTDGAWRAETAALDVHVNPGNPAQFLIVAPAAIRIARADGWTRSFSAREARASVRFTPQRSFARASFETHDAQWRDAGENALRYGAADFIAHLRPDPRQNGALQLAVEARGLTISRPPPPTEQLGADVAEARAAIVFTQRETFLRVLAGGGLEGWRAAQGEARIEMVQAQWGPGRFSGDGVLRLDDERRLEGRVRTLFLSPRETMSALAQSPSLSAPSRDALGDLAQNATPSGELETFLEFRDGWLSIGSLRLRALPPLFPAQTAETAPL